MKPSKLSAFIAALSLILFPQTLFAKQNWLKCQDDKRSDRPFILMLDDAKQSFEVQKPNRLGNANSNYKGKAIYFHSSIKFEYKRQPPYDVENYFHNSYVLNRATLKYNHTLYYLGRTSNYLASIGKAQGPSLLTGFCEIIANPSIPANQIKFNQKDLEI